MKSANTDEINPAYDEQSGYEGKYPPDWEARKEAIKQRDGLSCQDCGIGTGQGKQLHVHHITHLSDGGSNRESNLELLCVDCHNDRHDHDITEGLDDYRPAPSLGDRLRQLSRSVVGGAVVLPIHVAGIAVLLTQTVGTPLWLAGAGYLVALAVGMLLRPGKTAPAYGFAGVIGIAIMQIVPLSVSESAPMHPRLPVLSAFVPALLAAIWWWRQR
jgi:hypothetical protein